MKVRTGLRYAPELWEARRAAVLVKYEMYEKNPFCWYCGRKMDLNGRDHVTLEHLIPVSRGGDYTKANFVLAHKSCNENAGVKLLCEKWKIRHEVRGWLKKLFER